LEALKEAIRQEVAAVTPEKILKVMDSYRERLHQFINPYPANVENRVSS
jgi:hypothetical protein